MNIQAMMKQAQKLQKDMMREKEEIDKKTFVGKSSFVTAEVKGTKKVEKVIIDSESLDKDEVEMLADMLVVAINDAMNQIDKETEEKLGKYTKGIPGLF